MEKIAFYDMDKTITRAPTWTPFLIHAARATAPWRLALFPIVGLAGLGYLAGLVDRAGLKRFSQRLMLGRSLRPDALETVAGAFADTVMETGVLAGARARIAADRAEGYRLVLATASHRYYAAAIGGRLGFDAVIATDAVRDADGNVGPLIEGENCYADAKLRMVEAWLAGEGLKRSDIRVRAYSDHVSDAPLLGWADEGFAVNAHAPLRALALARGWPLLDWRGSEEDVDRVDRDADQPADQRTVDPDIL